MCQLQLIAKLVKNSDDAGDVWKSIAIAAKASKI